MDSNDALNHAEGLTPLIKHRRRPRYSGKHPRRFEEKYKELDPKKYPETIHKVTAGGKTPAGSHRAICLAEIVALLDPHPGQIAVDATLGYGGHAREILRRIQPGGKLVGIDTDPVELPKTTARLREQGFDESVLVVRQTNYAALPRILAELEIEAVDMILADLGCSSMQLDDPARGFTFKMEGPLDLRMNPQKGRPASAWLENISETALIDCLRDNADESHAELIGKAIHQQHLQRPIQTTSRLATVIKNALLALPKAVRDQEGDTPIRRTFQALRIAVNDEFSALETFLRHLPACLKPGGRGAILTFHSGEDRRVKKAFQMGKIQGAYAAISEEVTRPTREEIHGNPRAASAKLRWAIRQ